MKRTTEIVDLAPRKRQKSKDDLEQDLADRTDDPFVFRRNASDIARGCTGNGYIQGKVYMRWAPEATGKLRIVLELIDAGVMKRITLLFSDKCKPYFSAPLLDFHIRDVYQVSLKGAVFEKATSRDNALPVEIHFRKGTVVKCISAASDRTKEGQILDTWAEERAKINRPKVSNGNAPIQDDWFSTPMDNIVENNVATTSYNDSRKTIRMEIDSEVVPTTGVPFDSFKTSISNTHSSARPREYTSSSEASPSKSTLVHPTPKINYPSLKPFSISQSNPFVRRSSSRISDTEPKPKQVPMKDIVQTATAELSTAAKDRLSPPSHSECAPIAVQSVSNVPVSFRSETAPQNSAVKSPVTGEAMSSKEGSLGLKNVHLPNRLVNKEKKNMKKQRRKIQANDKATGETASALRSRPVTPQLSDAGVSSSRVSSSDVSTRRARLAEQIALERARTPASEVGKKPVEEDNIEDELKASLTELQGNYTPLSDLNQNGEFNVIGVISFVNPVIKRTSSGDFSVQIKLVDPSNWGIRNGFSVTFFSKSQDECRKHVVGRVMLFRGLRVSADGPTNGSCPSYKHIWRMLDPESGRTAVPMDPVPDKSRYGEFPTDDEVGHMMNLSDWWKKEKEKEVDMRPATPSLPSSFNRQHRLIKDVGPYVEPQGYFDCTVEILKVFKWDEFYFVYVTDYTHNENLPVEQGDWCEETLRDKVLRIEFRDGAIEVAKNMKVGEFYKINNARIRVSNGGGWEGKFVEGKKITKMNPNELDAWPEFTQLLQRKGEWAKSKSSSPFDHRLFKEVEVGKHFHCTVEVLDISIDADETLGYIYVTDYTPRSDLGSVLIDSKPIAENRDIVKILVKDRQLEAVKELSAGDFISIKNLHLRRSVRAQETVYGKLGGDEKLILKLRPQGTGNEHLIALLVRKKEHEDQLRKAEQTEAQCREKSDNDNLKTKDQKGKQRSEETSLNEDNDDASKSAAVRPRRPSASSIKQLRECGLSHHRYRIVARVVNVWPKQLRDCVVLHCDNCNTDLSPTVSFCGECHDSMIDDHVRPMYRFFLQLEDEENEKLTVAVVNEKCTLLDGLPPEDLRESDDVFEQFKQRIDLVFGDLVDEQDNVIQGGVRPNTPLLQFIVGCLKDRESGKARFYLLEHYSLVDDL
ncbi:hypothetical protein C8Q75DRAFT_811788 [Abortiporus biennis]|nr:hypothetical protein C8Q75DRAFT_811788 [Abortiporus biennis]